METSLTLLARRMIAVGAITLFIAYCIYWIMFVPFYAIVLIHGGWNMFYSFIGADGVLGQLFFWLVTIFNPLSVLIVVAKIFALVSRRKVGTIDASL